MSFWKKVSFLYTCLKVKLGFTVMATIDGKVGKIIAIGNQYSAYPSTFPLVVVQFDGAENPNWEGQESYITDTMNVEKSSSDMWLLGWLFVKTL